MNYALIGSGRISTNHIKACLENNIKIVAICDVSEKNMQTLLEKHDLQDDKSIKRYTDYKQMLDCEKIDFVSIATESGLHAQIALHCIKKGVHTIIEKPMAMSIEDCDKIIALSNEKNVKVCACHQNRFNASVQKMRTALDAGDFGRISHATIHVRWNRNKDYYTQAPWRGTWEQDGGALMNQCIHGIDLLRWTLGDEVEEVYGVTRQVFHDYLECEDLGTAIVKFKNGVVGTIEGTTNVYPQNLEETLYVFGEKGTVKLGGKSVNSIDVWDFKDKADNLAGFEEKTENIYGNGHTSVWKDFIEAIKDDKKPYIDAYAGKRAVELILAIYKSSFEKKVVKLPLTDCESIEFKGKF
ncbi:MAG: Gfo/Idh/MocA family oxidoreductase [Clostridia bacterium]